jgi:hypothetical protein
MRSRICGVSWLLLVLLRCADYWVSEAFHASSTQLFAVNKKTADPKGKQQNKQTTKLTPLLKEESYDAVATLRGIRQSMQEGQNSFLSHDFESWNFDTAGLEVMSEY